MQPTWSTGDAHRRLEPQWERLRWQAGGEHASRGLTLNFVARAHDAGDANLIAEVLWNMSASHPARVFIIVPGESGTCSQMRLAVHPRGSELAELTLPAAGAASWIAPALASDLPVVLLWRASGALPSHEFEHWVALADRILLDSHRIGLPAEALAAMARRFHRAHITDLTWPRLTPWRQLLAQGLEVEPGGWERISEVRIVTGAPAPFSLASLLLAGWLFRQLQWRPEAAIEAAALRLSSRSGTPLTLRFARCEQSEPHGLLRAIRVTTSQLGLDLEHHGQHLQLAVSRADRPLAQWASPNLGRIRAESPTLAEELRIRGADPLFQESLEGGLELLSHLHKAVA